MRGRLPGPRFKTPLAVAGFLVLVWLAFAQPGDPALYPSKDDRTAEDIYVVDHGYHAGLIVPIAPLADVAGRLKLAGVTATLGRIIDHRYVEIGWGDEGFYRQVPTIDRIDWLLAYTALTNVSRPPVLHIVGFDPEPRVAFPKSGLLHLKLSEAGFERLAESYDATIATTADDEAEDLGPGLYGDSEFYRARGIYNGLNDCNQRVAQRLAAAGVPASRLTATTSLGLMTELRWRAGAD